MGIKLIPACHFPFICCMVFTLNQSNHIGIGLSSSPFTKPWIKLMWLPESHGHLLIKLGEVWSGLFVAKFCHSNNFIIITDWKTQNIPEITKKFHIQNHESFLLISCQVELWKILCIGKNVDWKPISKMYVRVLWTSM